MLLGLACLAAAGCSATIADGDGRQNGNQNRNVNENSASSNANRNSDSAPGDDEVRVVFRNFSTEAVNVQFYATNSALTSLPDDLFVDANLVTVSIGLAGSALLGPAQMDTIFFECTDNLVIGTGGGAFLDDESGEMVGQGPQRYARQGPQFSCGASIVYTYDEDGSEFTVTQSIQ